GDIRRCEPPRHLMITWEYQGNISHVDVELIPVAKEQTVLSVTHHCPPDDHWETYGPAATGVGWEAWLRALSLHVADDAHCDPDDTEKFASTPEGRELTRQVADAWGRVDHEAGTPASDAETRALRTAAFYVGRLREDEDDE
nr:SRPBCC domain-containing protein [Micromonospora sp. DSM 115978]